MSVEFVALGGAIDPSGKKRPIGGSAYALIDGNSALLVDFGIYPSNSVVRRRETDRILSIEPQKPKGEFFEIAGGFKLYKPSKINFLLDHDFPVPVEWRPEDLPFFEILKGVRHLYVFNTHAHADHSGALPWLYRQFPNAEVFMTEPTLQINSWSWHDHLQIARRLKKRPFYDKLDVARLCEDVNIVDPGDRLEAGPFDVQVFPSGHILGAVSVLVRTRGAYPVSVFFSGDISFKDQRTVCGAPLLDRNIMGRVDALVIDSTYAGKTSPPRKEMEERLVGDVEVCLRGGGKFLAAALTVGRAQELFSILKHYGVTERWPIYIDGAARRVSRIYHKFQPLPIPDIARHFINSEEERKRIAACGKPLVVITSSGMYTGGPSVYYASSWCENPENVIARTSYQDPCSAGDRLAKIKPGQPVNFAGKRARFNAKVRTYSFSAHLDGNELVETIDRIDSSRTFLVHGEEQGMDVVRSELDSAVKTIINTPYRLL